MSILLFALAVACLIAALTERNSAPSTNPSGRAIVGIRNFSVVMAAGLVVASPLLLRNAVFFGNPIYPFIFGGKNTEQLAYFSADYSLTDYVRFRVHEVIVLLGSIVAASIIFGFLRSRSWSSRERFFLVVLSFYLVVYLVPSLSGSHVRYLAPILPVAAVLAGQSLSWWLVESHLPARRHSAMMLLALVSFVIGLVAIVDVRPDYLIQYVTTFAVVSSFVLLSGAIITLRRAEWVVRAVTFSVAVALLVPGVLAVAADRYPPREAAWNLAVLPEDPAVFLDRRLGSDWRMWQWINQNTPPITAILTFEARLFYLDREVVFAASHVLLPTFSMTLKDAVTFVRILGVTYILDSPWSHTPEINRIFWSRSVIFLNLGNQTYFSLVHSEGEVKLFAFAPP